MPGFFEKFFGFGEMSFSPYDIIPSLKSSFVNFANQPIYVLVNWFFLFSFIGYILECIVLSIETHSKVTNRGFCHLPICIIYGFCAVLATIILSPLMVSPFLIFMTSMILATTAELITAHIMVKMFGGFWWDYSMKRFNYKGMISLETSLGWGLVGIIFFYFLNGAMLNVVASIPSVLGIMIASSLTIVYVLDFIYCSYRRFTGQEDDTEGVGRKKVE